MDEMSFEKRILATETLALRIIENPDILLGMSQKTIDFFELNLVKFHNIRIPQCSVEAFEYFLSFLEDNPGIDSKNIRFVVNQLTEDLKKIPDINRPKNEIDLENKIKKLYGRFLVETLIELWKDHDENLGFSGDDFKKHLVCIGIEFSMTMKEIFKSYLYDVHGNLPKQYQNQKLDHSIRYIRTYLCLRCEQVFFSESNNAKYCPICSRIIRREKQRQRRNSKERQERCLYCHKVLPISETKPKKYCNDDCRYEMRKK